MPEFVTQGLVCSSLFLTFEHTELLTNSCAHIISAPDGAMGMHCVVVAIDRQLIGLVA